jgi:phospholipid transport system substrate-binding protein
MFNKIICIFTILIALSIQSQAIKEKNIQQEIESSIKDIQNISLNKTIDKSIKFEQISKIIDKFFDYKLISRLTLGKRYIKLSKKEKIDFQNAFTNNLKKTYINTLLSYKKGKILIDKTEKIKSTRIILYTKFIQDTSKYEVNYKLYKKKKRDKWKIYDVDIMGVSFVKTYKNQFSQFLKSKNIKDLIIKLNNLKDNEHKNKDKK